jgi:predicted RND superfamily exporter protein
MNVGSLFAESGFATVKAEAQRRASRHVRQVKPASLTGLLLVMAVGFAVAAFTVSLAGEVGTFWSLAILAAVLLVLAGMVQTIARIPSSRRRTWRPTPRSPITEAFVRLDREPSPGSALVLVAVVAVVGFLLVRQIFHRR